jgi:predicted nucleotidyltransferase component of viral defense system
MINREEMLEFAREFQLEPNVVEKDYALGWLLAGVGNHPVLRDAWVFKGGTCLKKCFFETYRFSEDLDFTVRDPTHLDVGFLSGTFAEIAEWVYDASGLEMPRETHKFEVFNNPRGKPSAQGRVGYRGPLGRIGDPPRMKLDLAHDEILVLEPVRRPVHHPYSDCPENGIEALCYAFEEVFAEKVRALTERLRPRDLYDVVHLHRRADLQPDRGLVRSTLARKCEFKGIPVPTFNALQNHTGHAELQAEWENMLAHQLPVLPPFDQFWNELPAAFAWLEETAEHIVPAAIAVSADTDVTWRAPAMASAWGYSVPLEAIRFAAANRLCVDLGYDGSHRVIEPYSLRRTKAGDIVLYAVRHDNGQPRAYRVDRIESAAATRTPFVPRYAIELTESGPVSVPDTANRSSMSAFGFKQPRKATTRTRSSFGMNGPTYVYECTYCGKRFNHKKQDSKLNKHKDKNSWDCPGRTGYFVDTKY